MYDTNDEMVNYEMLLLSYIWQEICPMFLFGTMNRGIWNYHVAVINNINSYTKSVCLLSAELMPYVGIFKKPYSIKKLKYKIDSWHFVWSFLYEMVFV